MARKANDTLSKRFVERLAPNGKAQVYGDKATVRLQLWMGPSGTKLWRLRSGGKVVTLGERRDHDSGSGAGGSDAE